MKATHRTEKFVTLELNQEQAEWLSNMVQNSLHDNESPTDAKIRREFWQALNPPQAEGRSV